MPLSQHSLNEGRSGDDLLITLAELSRELKKRDILLVPADTLRRWCNDGVSAYHGGHRVFLTHQKIGRWFYSSVNRLELFLSEQAAET